MQSFKFTVKEVSVGPGQHSWVAVEEKSGSEIPLPKGGNTIGGQNSVGQYPEIQDYLAEQYGIDVSVTYVPEIDELTNDEDGKTRWVFKRPTIDVVVIDIPRTMFRIGASP